MPQPSRLLIVDDDERFRVRLGAALENRGLSVALADSVASARLQLAEFHPDGIVTDLRMPGETGLQLVAELCALPEPPSIVVLTGYGSIATAVEAMRLGALNYLIKPCHTDQVLAAFVAGTPPPEQQLSLETPSLAKLEREHIERVLVQCGGNISKAARVLGIHRRTLQYKLAKFPVSR